METVEKVVLWGALAFLAISALGVMQDTVGGVKEGITDGVSTTTEVVGLGVALGVIARVAVALAL